MTHKQWMVHLSLVETDGETSVTPLVDARRFLNVYEIDATSDAVAYNLPALFNSALGQCFTDLRAGPPPTDESQPIPVAFVEQWKRVMHGGMLTDPQDESDAEGDDDQSNDDVPS